MELLLQRPMVKRLLRLDWVPVVFAALILTGIMSYYAGHYLPLAGYWIGSTKCAGGAG